MTDRPTVVSLFSGIGGLDLGFVREGFKILWANEFNLQAAASYETNLGLRPVVEDIDAIAIDAIPRADVVIGGPPCQSFSLVGRRFEDDPRGHLVWTFTNIVSRIRPRAFVLENVPGMEASLVDGVRLPIVLARTFAAAGYDVAPMKLNAADYMVPQLRRRLFLIGIRGAAVAKPDPETFSDHLGVPASERLISASAALDDLGPCVGKGERATYAHSPSTWLAKHFRAKRLPNVSLHECPRLSATDAALARAIPPGGNYRDVPDEIATDRIRKFKISGGRSTTYGRLHPDRPSYTVNTFFRRPNVGTNFHYRAERLITPREALRLQAFPDDFELVYSSQDGRNAQIGNAVPPLLGQAVAWAVRNGLRNEGLDIKIPLWSTASER